jgi:hypothetical protein
MSDQTQTRGGNNHLLFRVVVFTLVGQLPLWFLAADPGSPRIVFWLVVVVFCSTVALVIGALGYGAYLLYQWVRSL